MTMLSILSQLPRTIVLLLQPGDFTKFQTFRNRGFICNLILTNRFQGVNSENLSQGTFIYFIYSCDCLFDGNITQNTKKLQKLMRSYQKINDELAKYFTKGDFVVETLPALLGLPPQIRRVDLISICYEKSVKSNHYFYYLFSFLYYQARLLSGGQQAGIHPRLSPLHGENTGDGEAGEHGAFI